jgi:hypothetical protein
MTHTLAQRNDPAKALMKSSFRRSPRNQAASQHIIDLAQRKTVPHSKRRILGEDSYAVILAFSSMVIVAGNALSIWFSRQSALSRST